MKRSRALGWGIAASAVAHVVVLGLMLSTPASRPALDAPTIIDLELTPKAGKTGAISGASDRPAPSSRAKAAKVGSGQAEPSLPQPIQAAQTVSLEAEGSGAEGGPDGGGGEEGTGQDSRWRVAPRGPEQLWRTPTPDCSVSNPDHIWPGRKSFCAAREKPEPARGA